MEYHVLQHAAKGGGQKGVGHSLSFSVSFWFTFLFLWVRFWNHTIAAKFLPNKSFQNNV